MQEVQEMILLGKLYSSASNLSFVVDYSCRLLI